MSDTAIRVSGLSKQYVIGAVQSGTKNLRESISDALSSPLRIFKKGAESESTSFWALKDVGFEVKKGEVVGIIGRNGAGKSTLLKVLSRIVEPTAGLIEINGRVGSLLEVGTGFHPELSGRENIFMNGAILGMSRAEVRSKFDEIVAFAEVDKFIDTPVKRYSSGMYTRLAFAVAAHLEPEILIVDEVLAVGDAQFQKKCMGKMKDVAGHGRTVLFVSHSMAAIQSLCTSGILLQSGTVRIQADVAAVASEYLRSIQASSLVPLSERKDRAGRGQIQITAAWATVPEGQISRDILVTGQPACFEFRLSKPAPVDLRFTVYSDQGMAVCNFASVPAAPDDFRTETLTDTVRCQVGELLLTPGNYRVNAVLLDQTDVEDHLEGCMYFSVEPGVVRGRPIPNGGGWGNVVLPHRWEYSLGPRREANESTPAMSGGQYA